MVPTRGPRSHASCPISTLPPEITSEIFVLSLEPSFGFCTRLDKIPSLPILFVCREWTEIALRTPWLWCRYSLEPTRCDQKAVATHLKTWLSRARNAPLRISTSYYGISDPIWGMLLEKIDQWKSIEAVVTWESEDFERMEAFWAKVNNSYTMRRLSLISLEPSYMFGDGGDLDDFEGKTLNLPLLTYLELGEIETKLLPKIFAPQVREISLKDPSRDVLVAVSERFPLVHTVSLTLRTDFEIFTSALKIFPKATSWGLILSPLALPSLRNKDASDEENSKWPMVRSLTLQWFDLSRTDALKIFAMFPNVVKLTLGSGSQEVLRALSLRGLLDGDLNPMSPACPRLKSVCLRNVTVDKPTLFAFSKARAKGSKIGGKEVGTVADRCLLTLRNCSYGDRGPLVNGEGLDHDGVKQKCFKIRAKGQY